MAKPIPLGVRGESEDTVKFEHTLSARHRDLPPVYSTPEMIGLMERAAFHALQPYCEGDEITVGTAINIEHRAATGIGSRVRTEAVLDPSLRPLMATIKVTVDDAIEAMLPDMALRIVATTHSGARHVVEVGNPLGHPNNPMREPAE